MKSIYIIGLIFLISACQTGLYPISKRDLLYEKEGKSSYFGHRRPVEEKSESTPELYVKKESTVILPKESQNYSGSLFSPNKPENSLFVEPPRGNVGETLNVEIKVSRTEAKPPSSPSANQDAKSKKDSKSLQDELIAALPKLEPGNSTPKVPTTIKMQVLRKLENGDVLVEANRASKNDWEANSIRVVSRLKRENLLGSKPITTDDLFDVNWNEIQSGSNIDRESSGWEDEYTMRWAGFEEARSKSALELEAKRSELQKVKDRLQERIVNIGRERGKIAEERDKVRKLREEGEQKVNDLNQKINDQALVIEQQKQELIKRESLLQSATSDSSSVSENLEAGKKSAGSKAASGGTQ